MVLGFLKRLFGTAQERVLRKYRKIVEEVNRFELAFQSLSDEELKDKTRIFKERLQQGESVDDLLPEAYAVVKNTCRRLMGQEVHVFGYDQRWDMIPYDVQIIGAIAMHYGSIAEMQTGEGKTLTAAMPLYLNALTGKPVHLVTVNDYLAGRDCQWIGAIFRWLGLSASALTGDVPLERRRTVYQSDIVYGTASEFGFDYLRDNSMATHQEEQVQRGHYFAIVDEVDSILIDEARTPLIITGPVAVSRHLYDELKEPVAEMVRLQKELCQKLASEAKKTLDALSPEKKKSRDEEKMAEEAYRKLWLVSKGMPRNKVLKRIKEDPAMRSAIDSWDLYYYAEHNKDEKISAIGELYITVDERASEYELTDKGIDAWLKMTHTDAGDFIMLDISDEYLKIDEDPNLSVEEKLQAKLAVQTEDMRRKERAHNLRQLLRAHLLMEADVDYMVQEQKVVIIDEHTGRPQPGRRFSDGLHQAIEAKENVSIQGETQTYATVTLQNYFRLYEKLAGMTGTGVTEASEFKEIYKLDVLEIPTNVPCQRVDHNDEMYMTEREKYAALLADIRRIHETGAPILVGTESVDVSEKLSRILKQNKLEHTVLNAKYHDQEAQIISRAGLRGAITISTNMAGRGTDIKLGEGMRDIGGLHVLGTTRHQSRRIDRQLRGRSGRQGDAGFSKFYISFEDPLMRLFSSPSLNSMLQRFRPPEGEPITAKILNKSIETAQKRIEQRNYSIRKNTLQYDDVMNKQRQEIYSFRNEVLRAQDLYPLVDELLHDLLSQEAADFLKSNIDQGDWDLEGFRQMLIANFPVSFEEGCFDQESLSREEIAEEAFLRVKEAFAEKLQEEKRREGLLPRREGDTRSLCMEALRMMIIRKLDALWQEHLLHMDHLRSDVHLRTVGQKDPLVEFQQEAFHLFHTLSKTLKREIAQGLFRFQVIPLNDAQIKDLVARLQLETKRSLAGELQKGVQENPSAR
ncbi:MAG: protein translocase subunit SecA [Chlamydiales bacterium]|jgi:preprotein translocase subunit SecA|nr:protein translocase subunit SecA [Chlamydiales bacterium]